MESQLLFAVFSGIILLFVLILLLRIQAFLALLVVCIWVGLFSGLSPQEVFDSIKNGVGGTLGFVATVIGLGAIFGGILEFSGGAQSLASFILNKAGTKNSSWALMIVGFIIAIPVFFDVAFIILVPMVYALSKKSKKSILLYALPLLAGLAITHSFIPPTPGPVAVADILNANLGWVIALGFIVGVPTAVVSGPLFAKFISKKVRVDSSVLKIVEASSYQRISPIKVMVIIFVPILLIVVKTLLFSSFMDQGKFPNWFLLFIEVSGHPFAALIIANVLAWYFLGIKKGYAKQKLMEISTKSFQATGIIILLTGAGGAFKQILVDTQLGELLASKLANSFLHPLVFAFIVAGIIRILQGSATTAMIAGAGITAPILDNTDYSSPQIALFVLAIASGATLLSHVNDSGFWLVGQYLGLDEKQTFKTWTIMTSLIAFTGLFTCLILWYVL